MARALGMQKILVSRFSGILSAYGISAADVVCEKQEACAAEYGDGEEDPPEVKLSPLVCLSRRHGCMYCLPPRIAQVCGGVECLLSHP